MKKNVQNLTITNQSRAKIPTPWLTKHLRTALKLLQIKSADWTITIVADKQMSKLHQQTMNIPTTTDVLTFDLRDSIPRKQSEGDPVELDTVLCIDEAKRRAKDLNHTPQKELLLYALHSLLHVQGYDDTTPRKSARMHKREDQILIHLGVGPLYARNSA